MKYRTLKQQEKHIKPIFSIQNPMLLNNERRIYIVLFEIKVIIKFIYTPSTIHGFSIHVYCAIFIPCTFLHM